MKPTKKSPIKKTVKKVPVTYEVDTIIITIIGDKSAYYNTCIQHPGMGKDEVIKHLKKAIEHLTTKTK